MSEKNQTPDLGTWTPQTAESPLQRDEAPEEIPRRTFLQNLGAAMGWLFVGRQPAANLLADLAKKRVAQQPPLETELPTDIISREELMSRFNITIHDLSESEFPDEFVELNFRRSAENERAFIMLKEGKLVAMAVFLVDSNYVDPDSFTPSQREFMAQHPTIEAALRRQNEAAKELNRQEIAQNQAAMRQQYQKLLNELEAKKSGLSEDRYSVELQALTYAYDRYLRDEPTEQDLLEIAIRGTAPTKGTGINAQGEEGPYSFVFVAVRQPPETVTFTAGSESLTISARKIPSAAETLSSTNAPDPSQSYPTLKSFQVAEEANEYGYSVLGGGTPGFVLRHELKHAQGVFDEADADQRALDGIMAAAEHMEETGSDEKYWVVFRTPAGLTITRNEGEVVV